MADDLNRARAIDLQLHVDARVVLQARRQRPQDPSLERRIRLPVETGDVGLVIDGQRDRATVDVQRCDLIRRAREPERASRVGGRAGAWRLAHTRRRREELIARPAQHEPDVGLRHLDDVAGLRVCSPVHHLERGIQEARTHVSDAPSSRSRIRPSR
jgi:hypothetical protein